MSGSYNAYVEQQRSRELYEDMEAEAEERDRRHAAEDEARQRLRDKLFGASDDFARQAPAPLADHDALLGEHLAQLRSAARHGMGYLLQDSSSGEQFTRAAAALSAIARTNLAIVKVLKATPKTPKTVHGGEPAPEPQD